MRPSAKWRLTLNSRTQSLIRCAILLAWTLFAAGAAVAQVTQVSLTPLATPSSGQPGVSSITVIGSNFPAGSIPGSNVTVSFTPSGGTTPSAITTATSVSVVAGTTERVLFSIPPGLSVSSATSFKVAIAGTTSTGTAFASSNSALLTVDPPASVTISPASAQQSQTLNIALTGQFSHFYQGLTTVSFGAGVTVNSLTVSSLTSATANITVAANATTGSRTMTVATGAESASSTLAVTAAPLAPTTITAANATTGFSASAQSVVLSATVTSTAGTVNAGTVTFTVSSGGTPLGSAVTSGTITAGSATATFVLPSSSAAGSYQIVAVYNAAAGFASSSDNTHSLTVTPTAELLTVMTVGTGTGTVVDNTSAISCSTASGKQSGTCSATYTNGTTVTLTETATSPSTFAGWGGACASFGTATACTLTANSPLSVTANFVPPPVSQSLTFPVGTNTPPQVAVFNCPSNSNPCTDPNAHMFQLAIPQITGGLMVTVTATEVPPTLADGLCEVGNTVLNDFDCRFATFFNYGTDAHGNTIVPLCYPYANGNCIHYAVYSGTPGNEPDPSLYSGGVNWTITWNNDTFTPPAPWAGSTPQLYDDPDAAPTPTSAIGTICTQPMTINGAQQSYSCQFEFDITTFFNATEVVDSGIGGNTKNFNDVVVAFPPIITGQLVISSAADAATVDLGSAIGFTINVSNSGPGPESNVQLNDPLPSGSGVTWSISPAYGGPGSCSISGPIGTQALSCSFGSLASGSSATLHVSGATPGVGVYVNAATASSNNQQYLTIATTTVQATTTTTAANASASFSTSNQSVTLTATVASTAGTVNGGSVTFTVSQGATTVGTPVTSAAVVAGAASASYVLPGGTAAGSYTITAVYNEGSGFETSSDNAHTLTVTAALPTGTTTTAANATATFSESSQSVTLAATVTSTSGTVNAGTVTFTVSQSGTTIGTAVTSGTVTAGAASATYTLPASAASGSYTITAVYNPAGGFATSTDNTHTLTVSVAGTTTTAANASASFSTSNQSVPLTATVTSAAGAVNVGTVTFTVKQGATTIGTAVTSGTVTAGAAGATYTLPASTASGSYTITAAYNAAGSFAASSDSTHTLTVGSGATTTTAANATATFSESSQSVTLAATVTSTSGTVNAGTVTFTVSQSGTTVGTAVTSGTVTAGAASASYTLPASTASGSYTITAAYNAAGSFAASSDSTHTLTVGSGATTTTAANATATFSESSQSVTLAATVTSTSGTVNTGTVTFTVSQSGTTIGTAVTSGTVTAGAASATYTLPASAASGSYTITAVYNAAGGFATSTDNTHTLTVSVAGTTTTAANASASFSTSNQSVPLTATVTSAAGAVNVGTVTFTVKQGATTIGTAVTSGTVTAGAAGATYTLPASTASGSYTITAAYNAAGSFAASSDSTHTLTVGSGATTTTAANATATFSESSQSVTLAATVTSTSGTVNAGTVTFTVSQSGTTVGTAVTSGTVTAGAASAPYTLPASAASGSYTITAVYNAAGGFATSTDNTHTLTVSVAGTTTTAANASASFSTSNQSVPLTATVTSAAGAVNVGTVTFTVKQGATTIGTAVTSGTVTAGAASASYTLPASTASGSYTITAAYNAAGSFAASSDSTHTLTVGSGATTTTAANATATFSESSQSVTLAATVTSTSGTVNAGTVTFTVSQSGTTIGTAVTSGTVTAGAASAPYTLPASAASGSYTITAVYNAAGGFATSTDNTHTLTVSVAGTTTTAANASASFSTSNQSVPLTATVTSAAGAVNVGTVTFTVKQGATTIGTAVTSGTVTAGAAGATYTLPASTASGSYTITAAYNAAGSFAASSDSTHTLTVGSGATTTTAANATATFSESSQSVTLAATVTSTSGTVNAGTVTFTVSQSGTTVGTAVTSGTVTAGAASATYTLPASAASGSYTITAVYNPAGGFATSTDNTHTLTVSVAGTTTTAANASASFSTSNQSVPLTATVTSAAGAVNVGTVTFTVKQGATTIGTAVTSGTVTAGAASASYTLPASTASGSYTITAAYNAAGSFAASSDSTHTLTVTASGPASITLSPTSGVQGQTLTIGVTGVNTLFVNGTTTATFGTGTITVNSVTVSSSTAASLNVTISPTAAVGVYTLGMTTGAQLVQANFTVNASSAAIASIAPSSEPQGFGAVALVVTGSGTHFANGTTTASITGGITVNSVVVSSLTSATVNVSVPSSATVGGQTVTLTTGGEVVTGTFTVTAGAPQLTLLNPSTANQATTLSVAVTGLYTHFGSTSVGSFSGTGITVNSTTATDATDAVLNITVAANASLGPRNVTITTGAEVASITGGFTVQSGVATIITNPTTAMQGQSFTLMVTGSFTHFVAGTTTITFADGYATVGTVSVSGPTLLSVPVTLSTAAPVGATTVSATTGTEVASATFNIAAGIPAITIISPNVGPPNSTTTVTVTSQFTNFVEGTTQASFGPNIQVSGGPSGGFGTVTVTSPTSFTATLAIASGATLGTQTVQVKTGTQTLSVANGFTVQNTSTTPPAVLLTTPVYGATGVPVNTLIEVEFTEPLNRATAIASNVQLSDSDGLIVPVTVSLDASGRILTITPSQVLAVARTQALIIQSGIQDVYGNSFATAEVLYFTTAYSTVTTGPSVIGTNPANGATGVPMNTTIVVGFSAPISPLTQPTGLTVTQGGTAVPGTFSFSTNAQQISFVPTNPFTAGASYAINYNSQLTDFASNALINPGSATFTAGSVSDTTGPTVTGFNPVTGSTGVGLNAPFIVMFSKAIDPLSLTAVQFGLFDYDTGYRIPGTITIAPNTMSATFTPAEPLLSNTSYVFEVAENAIFCCVVINGYTDVAGNAGSGSYTLFTTGTGRVTTAPTVVSINPLNGTTTSVPVNVQIAAVISTQVDPLTVTTSSITLTPSVAGTVTLASDGVTLQFTPSANLLAATTYTVNVSGFKDVNGNTVTPFTSTFLTNGTTETTAPTVTVNPASGTTIATLTTPVVITFSGPINPQTVNSGTVYASQYTGSAYVEVAGTLAVSAGNTVVTLTPISPWEAGTAANTSYVYVYISGVQDPEGNSISANSLFYTPVTTPVVTPLTITSVTPANDATGVGQNAAVSVTFSHSVNPATVTAATLALFTGDSNLGAGISMSADNRTAMVTTTLPASSIITVIATTAITDLYGNALTGNLTSQFTTALTPPNSGPSIVTMRPGYGATGVPTSSVITLFANAPLNASTVNGGVHVSQNGALVSGAANTIGDGTSVEFVPTGSFTYGALIEVNVDQTVTDQYGNPLTAFYGSFTVVGNPTTTAPAVIAASPINGAQGVPLNAAVFVQFSQALNPSTVSSSTAYLTDQNNSIVPATVTLLPSGNTIEIKPSSNLTAGTSPTSTSYNVNVTIGVQNTNGLALASLYSGYFYTGTAADTTAPAVLGVAPPNNQQNVGLNGLVMVTFSEPIDPITANSNTISLSYGTPATAIPTSVSFNSTNTQVTFTPTTPLPPSSTVTVAVTTGILDVAGNAVTAQSTTFKTAATADTVVPTITVTPLSGATNVPTNSVVVIQFSEPINAQTVSPSYYYLYDTPSGQIIGANLTVSADGLTTTLAPAGPLPVGTLINVYSSGAQDLSGNVQTNPYYDPAASFTTSYNADSTVPQVIGTNPANGATAVPTNTVVVLYFNEPVNPATLSQVTLSEGGSTVPTTQSLSNGNQALSLTPATPLLPSASYTITAVGVKDTAGNQLAGTFTSAFSTGLTIDLVGPTVTGFNPVSGSTGVGLNVPLMVMFSKPINPLSLTAAQFGLYDYNTNYRISGTIIVAANAMSATFTPSEPLLSNTSYGFEVAYCYIDCTSTGYTDVAGNAGSGGITFFTTSTTTLTTAPTVVSINPPNGTATTVPQDVYVAAVISAQVDPLTVSSNSITLTPAVSGTVTLAADQVTLEFVPNAILAASTTYTVNVGGFKDVNGNTVTPFTSTFKTNGTTTSTEPTVTSNPASGATIATLTTPVVFTFSGPINPQTVNSGTMYAVQYLATGGNAEVAGTLAVSSGNTIVTFTPLSPWAPSTVAGNAYVYVYLSGVQDPAGDAAINTNTLFYTPVTSAVVTPLTVTSVTPANGATGVGQNAVVSVVFSHSVNPATVSQATLGLYVGDIYLNAAPSMSADNRTATFTVVLPASSTITVVSWPGITDLSGNALTTNLDSQFTTAATPPTSAPSIVTMLPGNGATGVPTNAVITLFANAPLNASTVTGGLHIVQNGVTLAGTTNITGGGTAIEFVPGALTYGALVEIHLDSTITDQYGNPLTAFYGSFTVVSSPVTTAPVVVAVSPTVGATGVPLNASGFIQFSQALMASTVNSSTVYMMDQNSNLVPCTVTLLSSGNTIQIKPSSPLTAGTSQTSTYYFVYVTTGVQNSSGVPLAGYDFYFYTGTAADTTAPTVLGVAPLNNQKNVGLNGLVEVTFSKPINPLTVNSTTVSLSYGSTPTQIPTTVTFDSTNTYVTFTPVEPLPASTTIKVTISGVQDVAGNSVTTQSTTFVTGAAADTTAPTVVSYSPASGATNVPTNASVVLQFSEPMNLSSIVQYYCVNFSVYYYYYYSNCLYDATLGIAIPANVSVSADGMTAIFTPMSALTPGDTVNVYSYGATDLAGNVETAFTTTFTVGSVPDTTPPPVVSVNPINNLTNVPVNAVVQVLFDRPVAANSLGGVTLKANGSTVVTSPVLSSAGQVLTLNTPDLLTPGTTYTITINGVADLAGNTMSAAVTDTFTTGTGAILPNPSVVSVTPANGATMVATNSSIVVQFTNPMNPVSLNTSSFILTVTSTSAVVPGTFALSTDAMTVTFTPASALTSGSVQYTLTIPYSGYLQPVQATDVALNPVYPTFTSFFQTQ